MSEAQTARSLTGPWRQAGHEPSWLLRYAAALLAVAVALSVRLALNGLVGEEFQPYAGHCAGSSEVRRVDSDCAASP
jgi:hypothetical protein